MRDRRFVLEETPEGRSLVVTDSWSDEAAAIVEEGEVTGLVLNYARGFKGTTLDFLESWGLRRLDVLDRGISDLAPIERLSESLESLSVQAAPRAALDLAALPRLTAIAADWALIGPSISSADALEEVTTWQFGDSDLHVFRDRLELRRLTIKDAPRLDSLVGVGDLPGLEELGIFLARRLGDIHEITQLSSTLSDLRFEDCPSIVAVDDVSGLLSLRFLGLSECGRIDTLAPLESLVNLEVLYAWGSTRVVDNDLSPLARLPRLREIRMRDRRGYEPSIAQLLAALPGAGSG